jgi:hypothetical protein
MANNQLSAGIPMPGMPTEPGGPALKGPISHSRIEPVDNGHMVTTHHLPHPKTPHRYPEPEVKVFEREPKSSDHLLRAVNHLWKKHGGSGTLAVDTDHDDH